MNKKKIVLVDDDAVSIAAGRSVLGADFDVLAVHSWAQLSEVLQKFAPAIILLNADLPIVDGFETLLRLKNTGFAQIPVIFLTTQTSHAVHERALRLGAADIVICPYVPELLLLTVERQILLSEQNAKLRWFEQHVSAMLAERKAAAFLFQDVFLSTISAIADNKSLQPEPVMGMREYIVSMTKEMRRKSIYENELCDVYDDEFIASAQLHDVGKIAIGDILQKPRKLTNEEFEAVKRHTRFGVNVIEQIEKNLEHKDFFSHAKLFASSHHERWDGNGYPLKMHGEQIPLHGRLMAIVDTYDALMSNRPYKQAVTHEKAREIIAAGAGTHFDPKLVDVFLTVSDEFAAIRQNAINSDDDCSGDDCG